MKRIVVTLVASTLMASAAAAQGPVGTAVGL